MPRDQFLAPTVAEALNRQEAARRADGAILVGPLLSIAFPAAGAARTVVHGLGTRPDGFWPARRTGAVYESAWDQWTAEVAVLEAPVANTIAVGRFFAWAVETPEVIA